MIAMDKSKRTADQINTEAVPISERAREVLPNVTTPALSKQDAVSATPPQNAETPAASRGRFWARLSPEKQKRLRDTAIESLLFCTILALLSLFISLRGATGVLISRLVLLGVLVCGSLFIWMLPELIEDLTGKALKHAKTMSIMLVLGLFGGLLWLDHWAPKPITIADLPAEYLHAYAGQHLTLHTEDHPAYADGQMIAGVPWKLGSSTTTITLAPTIDTKNIKLEFDFLDSEFIHAAQISHLPNVTIEPKERGGLADFQASGIDNNGHEINTHSATPDEVQTLNNYPASNFIFRQQESVQGLPATLVLISGNGYQLGNFSYYVPPARLVARRIHVTGSYDAEYGNKTFTVPVEITAERLPRR